MRQERRHAVKRSHGLQPAFLIFAKWRQDKARLRVARPLPLLAEVAVTVATGVLRQPALNPEPNSRMVFLPDRSPTHPREPPCAPVAILVVEGR